MISKGLLGLFLAQLTVAQYGGPPPTGGASAPAPAPSAPPDTPGQHNVGIEISGGSDIAEHSYRSTFSRMVASPLILRTSLLKLAILSLSTFQGSFIYSYPLKSLIRGNSGQIAHSVTQSSFGSPCKYLTAEGNNSAGFDSSLVLATTFTLNITSTDRK